MPLHLTLAGNYTVDGDRPIGFDRGTEATLSIVSIMANARRSADSFFMGKPHFPFRVVLLGNDVGIPDFLMSSL